MRIVVNGQQAFGKSVLEALMARGDKVIAVYCEPDGNADRPDPIKSAAIQFGLPVYQPASFKKSDIWAEFENLRPDLCVMAYVTKIVPEEFLNIPIHGTIQYHPSLLPQNRGPSSINWPIIQGKNKTGLSIFWPDNGLDTGPLLIQKEIEIAPDDTLGSVYFNKLFPLGVDAMLEGVDLVKAGNAPKIIQNESEATYESWCTDDDVLIDWSQNASKVYNLIRGADPQPGAWTKHNGSQLRFYDCNRIEDAGGSPGVIISLDDEGFTVAATDGGIFVKRVRYTGGNVSARDYAEESGLGIGDCLG